MDKLEIAVAAIVNGADRKRYPEGISTEEILDELQRRGQEFGMRPEFISFPDVCQALRALYPHTASSA